MGENKTRKPFVFALHQNWPIEFHHSVLAYDGNMLDETIGLLVNRLRPVFFVGIGTDKVVMGPFCVDGNPYRDSTPLGFYQLDEVDPEYGIWEVRKLRFPWRIRFIPEPPHLMIRYGLKWDAVCKLLDISSMEWQNLIDVELTAKQIDTLAERLRKINSPHEAA